MLIHLNLAMIQFFIKALIISLSLKKYQLLKFRFTQNLMLIHLNLAMIQFFIKAIY